jgi:hypothetical protein
MPFKNVELGYRSITLARGFTGRGACIAGKSSSPCVKRGVSCGKIGGESRQAAHGEIVVYCEEKFLALRIVSRTAEVM